MTKLGLPDRVAACLFDLDGVLTETAVVHAAAWKETFDDFLRRREGPAFRPFDATDYEQYVDGRPRVDGVRVFLASRGIELPEGKGDDPPESDTVRGLGNRKNALFLEKIRTQGVEPYAGSVRYVDAVRAAGLSTAVVSSSANCREILISAGMEDRFDVRIDGLVAAERRLSGKPHPDTFLEAARDLGAEPQAAAVFEDALAGMDAGRAGGFGAVVGVDRVGQADALRRHGADIVVSDLAELLESPS
ncbi:beta-phosphoglucomutase family hydrolase [Streptomyces sp. F001]|uniref:HAD family hydrolase n=1 Tax=Streptomyces sp. F001 TaxID=1510026 RepID=UPI00101E6965|nr:beta-phosphoglucomutase family hydrolase [Streptomyces sp. F001]RZB16306.1 beta-phosphoglucomutase family hydrolase [Streptomyces sp. F001]